MRDARPVVQGMLGELKWRPKTQHAFNSSRRSDLYIIANNVGNVAAGRQMSKAFRHPRERIVGMKKFA